MDFKNTAKFGSFISKDYALPLFNLLVMYNTVSASEAASRLGIHIRTVQDFMEAMTDLGILSKEEVYERKRPYFRYTLVKETITININLAELKNTDNDTDNQLRIREANNAGARYTTARNGQYFSTVSIWRGKGRDGKERKVNLTIAQGKFLYNLPFPNADYQSVKEIMNKANIEKEHENEIIDIVKLLMEYKVVESF